MIYFHLEQEGTATVTACDLPADLETAARHFANVGMHSAAVDCYQQAISNTKAYSVTAKIHVAALAVLVASETTASRAKPT
jgi:hypothetical protein